MEQKPVENKGSMEIFRTPNGKTELQVKFEDDTVWLTQKQMSELFAKDVRTINEHIINIFKEEELAASSVVRNFRITALDGKSYQTNLYNLDVIISVGYRVKSKQGTQFRIWATKVLKDHLVNGVSVNNSRLTELKNAFEAQKENYMQLRIFLNKFLGSVARKDVLDALIDQVNGLNKNIDEIRKLVAKIEKKK